jgi:hypothetical protein
MTPLIRRDSVRFDPIHGDTRHRVPPRIRRRPVRSVLPDVVEGADPATAADALAQNMRRFMAAFAGGFVFFSILIF